MSMVRHLFAATVPLVILLAFASPAANADTGGTLRPSGDGGGCGTLYDYWKYLDPWSELKEWAHGTQVQQGWNEFIGFANMDDIHTHYYGTTLNHTWGVLGRHDLCS